MACLRKFQRLKYCTEAADCNWKALADENRVFTNLYGRHEWHLKSAASRGDWYKTKEIIQKGPNWIVNEIEGSGLRGRGGASFPTGIKLKYMLKKNSKLAKYVVVNGAEGEPGTCKDRELIRHEPHKVIEGALMVGRAITASAAIIYVRQSFYNEACNLQMAIAEAYEAGLIGENACDSDFDFDVFVQRGTGQYVTGEETSLLNCLMGIEARPRRKPPYPSEKGYFDKPTLVLNTETVAIIPAILRRGSKWFRDLGCKPHSSGINLFNISGHVERPCTVEEQLGVPLRYLIDYHAGGVIGGWDNLLAVMPGGPSSPLVPKSRCNDLKLDVQSLQKEHTVLGTGAVIVINKSYDILEVMKRILLFYKRECCRQCTRCRGQSSWGYTFIEQFGEGIGQIEEIDWLWKITEWAKGNTICAFSTGNAFAIRGFLLHFREEIEKRLREQNMP